jgi:uncharacterized protein YutE (UPF0331/DUF86 family)
LARLEPLAGRSRAEFDADPYLRDIVERNLEVAAQCCIDISHRIIALERAEKPRDYYEAILRLGTLGVVSPSFAQRLAPLAGLRNILIHEYVTIDWNEVYSNFRYLPDLAEFSEAVRRWLESRVGDARAEE